MKLSFSTLACPDWNMTQIVEIASYSEYDGIELRFVENEDSIWKLPAFSGTGLAETRRMLQDHGLQVACVDTSCRFHFPDAVERSRWIVEGEKMAALAAELEAPAIRVFGDTIQPGADRASTRGWIADAIHDLSEKTGEVEVWLESHGDFSLAKQTTDIVNDAKTTRAGILWDPANSWAEHGENPKDQAAVVAPWLRHVHMKDMRRAENNWRYVMSGEGDFPFDELMQSLRGLEYDGFASFEWEKKWHPEIEGAEVALPHFVKWFRARYEGE